MYAASWATSSRGSNNRNLSTAPEAEPFSAQSHMMPGKKKKFDSFSVKSDGSSSWRYFCQLSFWLPAQPSTHFNGNETMSWCTSSLLFKFYCLLWCIIQRFKASSFTIWTYGKKSCLGILWCRHYTVWSLCQIGFKAWCCSRGLGSPLQKTRLKLTWLN